MKLFDKVAGKLSYNDCSINKLIVAFVLRRTEEEEGQKGPRISGVGMKQNKTGQKVDQVPGTSM